MRFLRKGSALDFHEVLGSAEVRGQGTDWGSGCFVSLVGGNAHEPMKGQKYQLVCKIRQNMETDEEVDI